jgi:hypothetical protein
VLWRGRHVGPLTAEDPFQLWLPLAKHVQPYAQHLAVVQNCWQLLARVTLVVICCRVKRPCASAVHRAHVCVSDAATVDERPALTVVRPGI